MKKGILTLAITFVGLLGCAKNKIEESKNLIPKEENHTRLFEKGQEGYFCYRIPGFIKAPNGDLLVFAEGRVNDCDDFGDIDLVMKKSSDGGETWTKVKVLVNNSVYKVGDPAPVIDYMDPKYPNGRIFLLYNTSTNYVDKQGKTKRIREVWYITSIDNGSTWSSPTNITHFVHRPNAPDYDARYNFEPSWTGVNTQGHGIQIKNGPKKGRLYFAGNRLGVKAHDDDFSSYRSYGYYSDDNGTTWKIGGDIEIEGGNESTAAELSNGDIIQAVRYQILKDPKGQPANTKFKLIAVSNSGGESWNAPRFATQLPDPICQGNLLDVKYKGEHIILFSNPANSSSRTKMSISASKDDGQTWPHKYLVDSGPASYSAMYSLGADEIGLVYEKGNTGGFVFRKINIADICGCKE